MMKQRSVFLLVLLLCVSFSPVWGSEKYEPTWESLTQHEVPEWMEDAKFGIYAHWGPYSVAFDWDLEPGMEITRRCVYFNFMYRPGNDERSLFEKHIGPVADGYGYKDLVKEFKAEKFDPAEWADLIAGSGAKFAGIALIHHDGYALWDSDVNPWCAGKKGPKRDLYGEIVKELRARDLRIIGTFHHLRTHQMWNMYSDDKEYLAAAQKERWDVLDPKYSDLYWQGTDFEKEYVPYWKAQIIEVIDKYQPDIIWFDGGKFNDAVGQSAREMLSYYFNKAEQWGKEVSVHNKLTGTWGKTKYNFVENFGVYNFENGRDRPERLNRPWRDDTSVGVSWPYYKGQEYMKARDVIVRLIDLTSRNGGIIVSLTPKPDGTLPQGVKDFLRGMGKWLGQNGEAIYGTRPWKIQVEGGEDNLKDYEKKGDKIIHIFRRNSDAMTWECIRFTTKGNSLYAMCTGIPPQGSLTIKSLGTNTKISSKDAIASVELLGSGPVKWKRRSKGLRITLPKKLPNDIALAFKIIPKGTLDR